MEKSDLGKLSKLKSGETLDWVQSGNDTLPLALGGLGLFWNWDFIEMGWPPSFFFEVESLPKLFLKQAKYEK